MIICFSNICFHKCFEAHVMFDLQTYLTQHVNALLITTLNINGIYWIKGKDLVRILKRMINLVHLYAVDTNLYTSKNIDFSNSDIISVHNNVIKTFEFNTIFIQLRQIF